MAADTVSEQTASDTQRLFEPLALGGLTLRNRIAVAPMTRVSADEDGRVTPRMADYYGAFAQGGFGLVITEGIYTDEAWSQGYLFQPGLADDNQRDAWCPVVERVHSAGGHIFAQLMHAGALSQGNGFRSDTFGRAAERPANGLLSWQRRIPGAGRHDWAGACRGCGRLRPSGGSRAGGWL
jgi:2,4-dienoyl-CoA reductase-like NADH-dependent reductase (Old Yellow Enzyme family)